MAYALTQSNHNKEVNSLAFPGSVAAGSLLVFAACYADAGSITAVSGGGTWVKIGAEQTDSPNNQRGSFWYCKNATGGATTVTPTVSGSFLARTLVIAEFSGVDTTAPLDVSNTAKAYGTTGTGTDAETSNSITPAGAGELIVAHLVDTGGNQGSISPGTGFTAGPVELGTGGVTGSNGLDWKSGGAGSQNATFTVGTGSHAYTVQIAAFKAAAGGSTDQIVPATINATSSMSGSVAKFAKVTGTANATSNVTANVAKVALAKPGTINATSTVNARVNKLAAIVGSINATSPVNATLSKLGQKSIVPASISSTSTVSGALQRLAALSVSMTATSFVTILGQIVQGLLVIELDRVSREAGLGLGSMYEYSAYTMATSAEHAEHARVNAGVGLGAGSHIDFTNAALKTDEASTEGNRVKDLAGIGGGSHANL